MRVLMTADGIGSVWTYAIELMRALQADGVSFILATMGRALSSEQRMQVHMLPNVTLRESNFMLESMPDSWAEVDRAGEWLLELEHDFSPDVVHLNGFTHGALPWRTAPLVVAHSCVLSWWRAVKRETPPPPLQEYHGRVQRGLLGASLVVAPTTAMLHMLSTNYVGLTRTRVIPHGRSAVGFQPAIKREIIVAVGRLWDEARNIRAVARSGASWPIYIAGDPGDFEPELGATHVHQLGVIPEAEVAALLARAAIYTLPARYEPFGLSVVEAAHAGCALLLGDIPTLRENWDGTALFVDPGDEQEIAAGLATLMTDATLRMRLGEGARIRAQRFTSEVMAAAYLKAYIEMSVQTPAGSQSFVS